MLDAVSTMARPYLGIVTDESGFSDIAWECMSLLGMPRFRYDARGREDRALAMLERLSDRGWRCIVVAGWDGQSRVTASVMEKAKAKGFNVWRLSHFASS